MALFLVERNFASELHLDPDGVDTVQAYNENANLRWLFSFLSSDKKKTYCLYEAPDAEALVKHARDLALPADAIVEVGEINPEMFTLGSSVTGHLSS